MADDERKVQGETMISPPSPNLGIASAGAPAHSPVDPPARSGAQPPEWAGALRQMYDAVVEEPLPEGIAQLLARLDAQSGHGSA